MTRSILLIVTPWILAGWSALTPSAGARTRYFKFDSIGLGMEWRFHPLVLDLNKDGHPDLVATARLADNPLRIWFADGEGNLAAVRPTWSGTGYAALATVQTLLSDGKGGFTEKILPRDDGYVGAQLADLNGDGDVDLILVGFQKAGVEIYLGDGTGNWRVQTTLPERRPGETMPGRDLLIGDLNHDGHLDLIAAFQRWGIYVYYGDGRGSFTGGAATFRSPADTPESLAVGDVNNDGNPDLAVNGNLSGRDQPNGPDVYLGDGRGGWKPSSGGLKVVKTATAGIALGDLDQDGNVDLVAAGNDSNDFESGYGLFWFKGDGKGGWQLIRENGLPSKSLSTPHSVTLADLDGDRGPEIIALNGGMRGSITIWKRQ
jgi:hypothetical protein